MLSSANHPDTSLDFSLRVWCAICDGVHRSWHWATVRCFQRRRAFRFDERDPAMTMTRSDVWSGRWALVFSICRSRKAAEIMTRRLKESRGLSVFFVGFFSLNLTVTLTRGVSWRQIIGRIDYYCYAWTSGRVECRICRSGAGFLDLTCERELLQTLEHHISNQTVNQKNRSESCLMLCKSCPPYLQRACLAIRYIVEALNPIFVRLSFS